MNRTELIQSLINKFEYKSYLEIGCKDDLNFEPIEVEVKVGVDPFSGGTHRMTSNEFFANNKDTFDLIFIDGLHLNEQVDLDIKNSLGCLNPNGTIVMHDCNPHTEIMQNREIQDEWTGDVWKAFVKYRSNEDLDMVVGDFDYGCGVIRIRQNSDPINIPEEQLTYFNLEENKHKWLRLMSYENLINWIGG